MGIFLKFARSRLRARLDTSFELILDRLARDSARKVLATIVSTVGSTYREPGARMLIMADGSHIGLLTGGCLEADLQLHADQVLRTNVARAVEYHMHGPDDILFGTGAGCEGAMRVLLEPAGPGTRAAAALATGPLGNNVPDPVQSTEPDQ
jgi:xanthine/CO dehydrogenase XdhC/CoxF family maturation factor